MSDLLRRVVTAFHCGLALALLLEAGLILQQGLVNTVWEQGFYGAPSPQTAYLIGLAVAMILLALFQLMASAVYLYGREGGGTAILVGSILLTCTLEQPALQWAVIGVSALILVDSVLERIRELPEFED